MKNRILALFGVMAIAGACWYSFSIKPDDFFYAALGDSGTTAFNSEGEWNNMENSWATGKDIESHYVRLKKVLTGKNVRVINMAVPGSDSSDLLRQASQASAIPLDYVTILIGANDFCNKTANPNRYESNVTAAIGKIKAVSPNAKILLSSMPDIPAARKVAETMSCKLLWKKAMALCDVSNEALFYSNWAEMNRRLQKIAEANDNVKYSQALSTRVISKDSLSEIDCFHPNKKAQVAIAEMTWAEGFFQ